MSSLRDFDSIFSNPRDILERYVQSRLDVEKDFGCPIEDIISRNIQSESYMKLCQMDPKTLETKFVDMDFAGRYEEKLVKFMNTELRQRVLRHGSLSDPRQRFLSSTTELHDYLKNTLMFFAPLIRQSDHTSFAAADNNSEVAAVLATPAPKGKRKQSVRERLVSDYRTSFTNHLKYCLLDDVHYDNLLAEFIQSEFPAWKAQVVATEVSEQSPDFNYLAFLTNILGSGSDVEFDSSIYPGLVSLHAELGLLESHLWRGLEKYFVKDLQEVVQGLIGNIENVKSILPFLEAYSSNYIERYINFISGFISKGHKNPTSHWKRRLDKLKTNIYLKEVTSSVFEFIKLMDDEDASQNVVTILSEVKSKSSAQDVEEICAKLKEEVQDRLLSEDLITDAIITFYFNIVKFLNIIDREMTHYQTVVGPIRQYLTKRPDIIKAVIGIWKDTLSNSGGDSETYRVLDVVPHQSHGLESDDDEAEADRWDVRNVDGSNGEGLKRSRLSSDPANIKYKDVDKLSLLFEMFGSDADFIEEYENILAEKLLLSRVADINEEIKNIELLKLRFGEQKLIRSAVILRDVDDSHRFIGNAQENLKRDRNLPNVDGLTPLNANMLFTSSGYWPINNGVTHFTYPPSYAEVYSKLHEQFKLHKSFMYLEQHNNLGTVELELSFRSGAKQTFRCEPIQAILISRFSSQKNPSNKPIAVEELAKEIQAHKGFVRGKMFYWVKKGVVKEVRKHVAASTPLVGSVQMMKSGNFPQKFLFNRGDTMIDESTQQGDDASYELVLDYVPHEAADSEADFYGANADELDNEQISRDTVSSRDIQANLKKFEPKILAILNVNGPKKLQKLKCLLDTVYKPEGMNMVGMNELAEILAAMVRSRKISVVNDIYSLYMQ